jgi:hypothetical protein
LNRFPTDTRRCARDGAIAVAALGRQVVVGTTTTAGRRAVAALFRAMHEPVRPGALGRLALRRVPAGWILSAGPDAEALYGSLAQARWGLRDRVTRFLMSARPDLLWLHAAGVAKDGHAVLIAGPSGSGKSSLAALLITHGFAYLGDDALPLDPRSGVVYPFPITPAVRTGPRRYLPPAAARALPKREVTVRPAQVATGPVPLGAIVFPRYAPDALDARPVLPAQVALEMLRQCRDLGRHREQAVRALTALAGTLSAWELTFADAWHTVEAITRAHAGGVGRARVGHGPVPAAEAGGGRG